MTHRTSAAILPIQRAVAMASPSSWRDGIVVHQAGGIATVALLDGTTVRLHTATALAQGEPVAVHAVAEVLAQGSTFSTARPIR